MQSFLYDKKPTPICLSPKKLPTPPIEMGPLTEHKNLTKSIGLSPKKNRAPLTPNGFSDGTISGYHQKTIYLPPKIKNRLANKE